LDKERHHSEHKTANMFVMFVLSHGEDGHFYASNGEKVLIQKIMDYFDGQNCPALREKPKLFFVQACQGGKLIVVVHYTVYSRTLYTIR